jgi:hypothetical protein
VAARMAAECTEVLSGGGTGRSVWAGERGGEGGGDLDKTTQRVECGPSVVWPKRTEVVEQPQDPS